jgi:VIT1/CCC1 family predicted Fe2+/Mn2+ transporter
VSLVGAWVMAGGLIVMFFGVVATAISFVSIGDTGLPGVLWGIGVLALGAVCALFGGALIQMENN